MYNLFHSVNVLAAWRYTTPLQILKEFMAEKTLLIVNSISSAYSNGFTSHLIFINLFWKLNLIFKHWSIMFIPNCIDVQLDSNN